MMQHGSLYSVARCCCVMGGYGVLMSLGAPNVTGVFIVQRVCLVPLALMSVVVSLHASSMGASARLNRLSSLFFFENVVYYSALQAFVLTMLPSMAALTSLYMLFDLGHCVRLWGTSDSTLLPHWLLCGLTWTYFAACVYAHGDPHGDVLGETGLAQHIRAVFVADMTHVAFSALSHKSLRVRAL